MPDAPDLAAAVKGAPDRTLDAALAVALFGEPSGLTMSTCAACPECGAGAEGEHAPFTRPSAGHADARAWCCGCSAWIYAPYRERSQDAAGAEAVIEAMGEKGHDCHLSYEPNVGPDPALVTCAFVRFEGGWPRGGSGRIHAATMSRAVAEAAIGALSDASLLPPTALALLIPKSDA